MNASQPVKSLIEQSLDDLSPEQLAQLWECLKRLKDQPVSALYRLHEKAIDTGITDLAEHHDAYLYGPERRDD